MKLQNITEVAQLIEELTQLQHNIETIKDSKSIQFVSYKLNNVSFNFDLLENLGKLSLQYKTDILKELEIQKLNIESQLEKL